MGTSTETEWTTLSRTVSYRGRMTIVDHAVRLGDGTETSYDSGRNDNVPARGQSARTRTFSPERPRPGTVPSSRHWLAEIVDPPLFVARAAGAANEALAQLGGARRSSARL
ncbi:hypothetical protein [Paramicrobacterium fandaimingii]|uniref:hypothetical protein n=1 Tax=Paramicrobacterium fandaimingii TaxID=2708079 RepID=UPI00141E0793|nr:hypothetical protein [Microbacterium fandaimingii]